MSAVSSSVTGVPVDGLARLAPLTALSRGRLAELAKAAREVRAPRGSDPLAEHAGTDHTVYLMRGEILLVFAGGGSLVVVGGSGDGLHPLNRRQTTVVRSKAITEVDLLVLDDDAMDIAVTWDEAAAAGRRTAAADEAGQGESTSAAALLSLANLRQGALAQLPSARIEELLRRFERVTMHGGEAVVREGDEGDWFYVIASGKCVVERTVGGVNVEVAELRRGDAFGEEALVSEARRNATVTMLTEGTLFRLAKADFKELLVEPLLHRLDWAEARAHVAQGAVWLDVRYPSEYQHDRLSGAINVPLSEVRNSFGVLDPRTEYIVYCGSGRRSAAAAFLFAQRGFKVYWLRGGLRESRAAEG